MVNVKNSIPDYGSTGGGKAPRGILRIFIENDKRPFLNGDLAGDFEWRMSVKYKVTQELIDWVADYLERDKSTFRVGFSRYAGCGSCPCSPGLIVYSREQWQNRSHIPAVWVELS